MNFKVRILDESKGTGAVTRVLLDASDGTETWGTIGVSENVIEASWEALVDSLEAGMLPGRAEHRARAPGSRRMSDETSSRWRARRSARARRSSCSRRCARAGWRSARGSAEFEQALRRRLGVEHVSAVSSGTARASPRHPRGRHRGRATRSSRPRSASSRPPTACSTRARARSSATSTRARSTSTRGRRGGGGGADDRACCRSTSSATRPTCPRSSALAARARALDRRGRLRGARRRARRRTRGGRARQPGGIRLLPEQAGDHGGGRRGRGARRRRPRSASTASATRAARPTWAGWTTTGSASTTACRPPLRARPRPARAARRAARRARAGGGPLPGRRSPASRASSCPARTRAATAAAGSSTWSSSRAGVDRDARRRARCASAGVDSKPYLPAIHLLSFYRERFGHREGEFPVCEDVAAPLARAAVLPGADRGQVERVCRRCAR